MPSPGVKTEALVTTTTPASDAPAEVVRTVGTVVARMPESHDAFGRIRVSNPQEIFSAQLTYDLQPLLLEQVVSGSGAAISHDSTNRRALFTFDSTPSGGKSYLQSFNHIRYQPGRSQNVFITCTFGAPVTNVLKFAGYCDGTNGVQLELDGSTVQWKIYSASDNGNEAVEQANWNLDPLNGTGPSGVTLNFTKSQIVVFDFQALYVGRVRCGFDIGGDVIWAHAFYHANLVAAPYWQTANLPIRVGMTASGTVSATMHYVCSSVASEGGLEQGLAPGFGFSVEGTVTAGSGTDTHILSVQPGLTFNSIVNRAHFILDNLEITVTGNAPVRWKLCIGQALTGAVFADVNATYSASQALAGAGTLSGSPAIVIAQGYVAATANSKTVISRSVVAHYPITLNAEGAVRVLGRLTVLVQGVGGASACRAILNWREIR